MLRIGLDIDDVLGDFMGYYYRYFECDKYPKNLEDHIITKNVQRILRYDRDFWLNMPVINKPDFQPVLYCTKRVNPKNWTKTWLELNGFPKAPIYQMLIQKGNKADLIKGKVDLFIDDSLFNVEQMNKSGIKTLLFGKEHSSFKSIYSLCLDDIINTCKSEGIWI